MHIVAMLHNQAKNTFHPILFQAAPFPGGHQLSSGGRYRSKGHHTEGFASREDAVQSAKAEIAAKVGARCALDGDIEWDGKEIPALTLLFCEVNGQLQPV